MKNPFRAAARKAFAPAQLAVSEILTEAGLLDPMVDIKATYQDNLRNIERRRANQRAGRAQARHEELVAGERIAVPEGDGNRAGRREAARRDAKQVRKGQAAYRATQEQRRSNRFTAGNMAKAAAGELGTPALQANVRIVLEREQAELDG